MVRTTVFLPEDLKAALERVARADGKSEAELIREGVRRIVLGRLAAARPTIPLFRSDDPSLAERAEDLLEGFGEG